MPEEAFFGKYTASIDSFIENVGVFVLLLAFLVAYVRRVHRMPPGKGDQSSYARFVNFFVLGYETASTADVESGKQLNRSLPQPTPPEDFWWSAFVLGICAVGLQGAYLTWGVLQERLITIDYDGEKFSSSQFLVFTNRAIAFCVAVAIATWGSASENFAPFYKYSFASFSNIISSWCQYEALKYVSFPTQVVSKSSKLIPVMVVGKYLSAKTYKTYEYAVAVVISLGVIIFTLAQEAIKPAHSGDQEKGVAIGGIVLLLGYITFDSFTSQWQGLVFKTYKISPYQMMLGVNAFSASFTFTSIILNMELVQSLAFISAHPSSLFHICLLSACGATGQLFIFYTIKRFGPLVFTMIMTTRQLFSIVLSCMIYSHPVSSLGLLGAAIVFCALGYKIYRRHQDSKQKSTASFKINAKDPSKAPLTG